MESHKGQKSEKEERKSDERVLIRGAGLTEEHIQFANYSRVDAIGN